MELKRAERERKDRTCIASLGSGFHGCVCTECFYYTTGVDAKQNSGFKNTRARVDKALELREVSISMWRNVSLGKETSS